MDKATISIPDGLRARVHNAGLNASAVCAKALLRSVEAIEKETPATSRQTETGAVSSQGVTS